MLKLAFNHTKYGKMIYLFNDIYFTQALNSCKIFDQDIIENHLIDIIKNSKNILDIGGHCGSHSIIYSKINPYSKIYTFEPQKIMFDILKMNIFNNKIQNIKPYNFAFS